ncbi:MAG: dipeptidase, partial [Desulfovibrionales bacterium]|nr:dipeptidase [Desulfovibrionales bacterium]
VQTMDVLTFDRGSMWTAFNYVANYAMLKYNHMIQDIRTEQSRFESRAFGSQQAVEAKALKLWSDGEQEKARAMLAEYGRDNAEEILDAWWNLSEHLYVKYNDGYINTEEKIAQPVFYPAWWLKAVGYENGPASYSKP